MKPLNMKGLVAAVVTPMTEEGELRLDMVPRIVEHLSKSGVVGIYIAGSTGEGMSLTCEERRAVAEAYVRAAKGRMYSIVQVGHNSTKVSAALATHAEMVGADAVSATLPGHFKPNDETGLIESIRPIVEAAATIPFYYYHIPQLSGVTIDPMRFTDLATDRLSTFCGIKYSDGATMHNLPLLQKIAPHLEFLSGSDEGYLQALAQGYQGAVGSTYNYAAPIYYRVRDAFEAGDLDTARLWQGRAIEMIDIMLATCRRASLKAMMTIVGIDCGPVRRPLDPATEEQFRELRRRLEKIGWFDWIETERSIAV